MSELIRPGVKGARWDIPRGVDLIVCRVTPGRDWWDLDDAIASLPGQTNVVAPSVHRWHAFPMDALPALAVIAERNPGRLIVHKAYRG
jgi:hypothetical protein